MSLKNFLREKKRNIYTIKYKMLQKRVKEDYIKALDIKYQPLVSIVMTVFNREKYVEEAIKSVLNQSYKNIELIIVNDGSTDLSETVIKKFDDSRIKYFYKENSGQLDTFKFAYKKVKGKYVTRVDSDDMIDEDLILLCVNEINKDSEIKFIYFNLYNMDRKDNLINISKMKNYENGIEVLNDLFEKFHSVIPDVSFWERGYMENVKEFYINRNIPFYIKDIDKIKFKFLDIPLYHYRLHEENYASNINNLRFVISGITDTSKFLLENHKEKIFKEKGTDDQINIMIAQRYYKEAKLYIEGTFNGANFKKEDNLYLPFLNEAQKWIEKVNDLNLQSSKDLKAKIENLLG